MLTANGSTVALPEAAVVLAERALAASTDPAANNALPWMNPAYREPAIPAANPRWGKPFTLTTDGVAPYVFAATVYPDGANSSQSTQVIRTVIQDGTTWKLGPNQ